MFESFYSGSWHHPGIAWLSGALALLAIGALRPQRARLWSGLVVLSCIDAWLTGGLSPLSSSSPWLKPAIITFVILGDARYFYLATRVGWTQRRAAIAAIAVAWIIPLGSWLVHQAMPAAYADPRWMFLVYESMFVLLALVLLRFVGGAARALTVFELVQYTAWASADVFILYGEATREAGYALRMVANFLYYGAFVPVAMAVLLREEHAGAAP